MKLSKRGEYGLRAMIELAAQRENQPETETVKVMQIKEIAERQHIPAKFLEQILLALKNAGLLHSRMGVGGGYYLARPAQAITLGQIVRILDGPLAPLRCVSQTAYESCGCPDEAACGLRLVMSDVHHEVTAILDGTSLADVTRRMAQVREQAQG